METSIDEKIATLMRHSITYGTVKDNPKLITLAEAVKDALEVYKQDVLKKFSDITIEVISYKTLLAEIRGLYGDDFIGEGVLTDTAKHTWDELVYENKTGRTLWK